MASEDGTTLWTGSTSDEVVQVVGRVALFMNNPLIGTMCEDNAGIDGVYP
jgi:hypothetical protein